MGVTSALILQGLVVGNSHSLLAVSPAVSKSQGNSTADDSFNVLGCALCNMMSKQGDRK